MIRKESNYYSKSCSKGIFRKVDRNSRNKEKRENRNTKYFAANMESILVEEIKEKSRIRKSSGPQ
jgi:general stress protein 26